MGWFSGVKSLHCQCIGFEGKTKRRLETARITWRASSKPDMDAFFSATSAPDIPLGHFAKGLPVILGKNGLKPASPTQINTYQGVFNACVALISTHPKALWKFAGKAPLPGKRHGVGSYGLVVSRNRMLKNVPCFPTRFAIFAEQMRRYHLSSLKRFLEQLKKTRIFPYVLQYHSTWRCKPLSSPINGLVNWEPSTWNQPREPVTVPSPWVQPLQHAPAAVCWVPRNPAF